MENIKILRLGAALLVEDLLDRREMERWFYPLNIVRLFAQEVGLVELERAQMMLLRAL